MKLPSELLNLSFKMFWRKCLVLSVLAIVSRIAPIPDAESLASLTENFSWENFHNWTDEVVKNIVESLRKGVQETPPEYWQKLIRNVTDVRVWSQWMSDGWQWIKSQRMSTSSSAVSSADTPDETLPSTDSHFNEPVAKTDFFDFSNEKVVEKAKNEGIAILDTLAFARWKKVDLCSYIEGVRKDRYNIVVNKIANLVHLPDRIKENLLEAGHARNGQGLMIQDVSYEPTNGSFHTGRFIVKRSKGGFIDIGYALANFQLVLAPIGAQDMDKSKDLLRVDGENLYLAPKAGRILDAYFKVNAVEYFIEKYEKLKALIQRKEKPKQIEMTAEYQQ